MGMKAESFAVEEAREAGLAEGLAAGREEGVKALISTLKSLNIAHEIILSKLMAEFSLTEEAAEQYLDKY